MGSDCISSWSLLIFLLRKLWEKPPLPIIHRCHCSFVNFCISVYFPNFCWTSVPVSLASTLSLLYGQSKIQRLHSIARSRRWDRIYIRCLYFLRKWNLPFRYWRDVAKIGGDWTNTLSSSVGFSPGNYIAENILHAIRNSKKIVIVLSNDFLDSNRCMYEFNTARMESI